MNVYYPIKSQNYQRSILLAIKKNNGPYLFFVSLQKVVTKSLLLKLSLGFRAGSSSLVLYKAFEII